MDANEARGEAENARKRAEGESAEAKRARGDADAARKIAENESAAAKQTLRINDRLRRTNHIDRIQTVEPVNRCFSHRYPHKRLVSSLYIF